MSSPGLALTGQKRKAPSRAPTPQQQLEEALRRQQERDAKKIRPADSNPVAALAGPAAAAAAPAPQATTAAATATASAPALSAKEQMKERLRLQRLQLQAQKRSSKPRAGGMAGVSTAAAPVADMGEVFGADEPESSTPYASASADRFRPGLEDPPQPASSQASQPLPEPVPPVVEDENERQLVDHLVAFIQKQGPSFELVVKSKNQDNPQFAWLFDKSSVGYRYYQYRMGKPASEWVLPPQQAEPPQNASPARSSPEPPRHSPSPPRRADAADDSDSRPSSSSASSAPEDPAATRRLMLPPPGAGAESSLEAMNAFVAQLEEDQPERAAEGQWLQERIRERSARLSEMAAAQGPRRAGDYPPAGSEFNRLMAKAHHGRGSAEPAFLDEERPQIGQDNKGYQLLRTMGWQEDTGLGRNNHGRVAPVKAGGANSQLGIGARAAGEIVINDDDDEITKYKKRMALAYRQRPNPNNAQRTPYWEDEKMNRGASQL